MTTSPEVRAAYAACEQRLKNHRGHILERARNLKDPNRREAFFTTYHSLRVAGPHYLPRPMGHSRTAEKAVTALRSWSDSARLCHQGEPDASEPLQVALADTMRRFQIPMSPWLDMETGLVAMTRGEPIPNMAAFLKRGRCLALSPSTVFFRIVCAKRGSRRYHLARDVDVDELAHDPAMFAYLVGVMCDVFSEIEHLGVERTSLPRELLERHGLDTGQLLEMRDLQTPPRDFLNLMRDLELIAWTFYESGVAKITQAAAHLSPPAITELDGFLRHYREVLNELDEANFAPARFASLAGGLEPRILSHPRTKRTGRGRPGNPATPS